MFVRSLTRRIGTWQLFIQQRMPLQIERLWSRRPTEHVFYYVKIRSSTFFYFYIVTLKDMHKHVILV